MVECSPSMHKVLDSTSSPPPKKDEEEEEEEQGKEDAALKLKILEDIMLCLQSLLFLSLAQPPSLSHEQRVTTQGTRVGTIS